MPNNKIKNRYINDKPKGFTIVELLVVISVISILTTVGIVTYIGIRKQSYDNQISSKVESLHNQLEKYKSNYGEYPLMDALNNGNSSTNVKMTNFGPAASILGVSSEFLSGPGDIKFHTQCATGCGGAPQKSQYEYVALNTANNSAGDSFTWEIPSIGCEITVNYDNPSYVFVYFNSFKGVWIFEKSPQGSASVGNNGSGPTSPQTCAFS